MVPCVYGTRWYARWYLRIFFVIRSVVVLLLSITNTDNASTAVRCVSSTRGRPRTKCRRRLRPCRILTRKRWRKSGWRQRRRRRKRFEAIIIVTATLICYHTTNIIDLYVVLLLFVRDMCRPFHFQIPSQYYCCSTVAVVVILSPVSFSFFFFL